MKGHLFMANQKQTHMSVEEYKAYLERQNSKSTNKYKNTTLWYDGLYFQSQKELDDYLDQKRLLMAGEIAGFLWQGVLVLVEGGDSKKEPAVTYRPDIVVFHNDGTYEIREDKGKKTPAYKIKETIIHQKFPNIAFKEV
jgi:hypothetical protein